MKENIDAETLPSALSNEKVTRVAQVALVGIGILVCALVGVAYPLLAVALPILFVVKMGLSITSVIVGFWYLVFWGA